MAWVAVALVIAISLPVLWVSGRIDLVKAHRDNNEAHQLVSRFHESLATYANSEGQNSTAFGDLLRHTSEVEQRLGYDNVVNGVQMGHYLLNGAPILPLAIHEMRRNFGDFVFRQDGGRIAAALENVLLRHLGKREAYGRDLAKQADSVAACILQGWSLIAALPISVLRAFDLVSARRSERIRSSLLFRLWRFVLALVIAVATLAGPTLAYLADKDAIEAEIERLKR